MNNLIKTLLQRILPFASRIGFDASDSDDTRLQKTLLALGSFTFIAAGALWGVLYFFLGEYVAGFIPFGYAVVSSLSVAIFHVTRRYKFLLFTQLLLILFLPFLLMIALGGFVKSSAVIIWSLLSPLGALLFGEHRQALRWLGGYLGLAVISGYFEFHPLVLSSLSPATITVFYIMNLGAVSAIAIFLLVYFVNQKNLLYEMLRQEQAKSENLLLNILPRHVAARLKQGEETIADDYDSVSIMVVDLVDFTPLSAACDPKAMVQFLGGMFSYFDQLVEKYGVEKIETVGDSYVIAAGLPIPRADHAKVVTQMALEIQDYFERGVYLEGNRLSCRIGINSGPITAGVIERKKISFNVWGDTINTASRMQTYSLPGQIQISEATYELVKDDFICEPRGTINVKGKGDMNVWLVVSEKEKQTI
ncbi:MAG: adenylate/guanylate cyclase domain-containing protein [Anaerolineales bacterium]|nr:adenylate/guanylate cyclase domain-containing protein [Anaerolineales bacterium]NUQ84465.1 adenylate/guanylate cyclase domain-containing protein [Anaerolineales bacterium]